MRILLVALCVVVSFTANAAKLKADQNHDDRVVIEVNEKEKTFILERMRRMLETLTSVQQSLLLDSPENADNLVRNLSAFVTENYPEGWIERMPEHFQQMETRLNERWRMLGDNNTRDPKLILQNTVQVMATCNACHRSFKIGLK